MVNNWCFGPMKISRLSLQVVADLAMCRLFMNPHIVSRTKTSTAKHWAARSLNNLHKYQILSGTTTAILLLPTPLVKLAAVQLRYRLLPAWPSSCNLHWPGLYYRVDQLRENERQLTPGQVHGFQASKVPRLMIPLCKRNWRRPGVPLFRLPSSPHR